MRVCDACEGFSLLAASSWWGNFAMHLAGGYSAAAIDLGPHQTPEAGENARREEWRPGIAELNIHRWRSISQSLGSCQSLSVAPPTLPVNP
jgi:hypothetical protein